MTRITKPITYAMKEAGCGRISGKRVVHEVSEEMESLMQPMLEHLAEGMSVKAFARMAKVDPGALRRYAWHHYREAYEKAQKDGADALAESALMAAVCERQSQDTIETTFADGSKTTAVKSYDNVQRSKLAADALWKMAASRDPGRYGTKGVNDEASDIANEIMQARRRVMGIAEGDDKDE